MKQPTEEQTIALEILSMIGDQEDNWFKYSNHLGEIVFVDNTSFDNSCAFFEDLKGNYIDDVTTLANALLKVHIKLRKLKSED